METVNPKNFIDIDPNLVSFITLKNGNMIMIDESTPAMPNKMKLFTEEENNRKSLDKPKIPELTLSQQINFSFEGNNKTKEDTTLKKNNFNLISNISNNISFSFLKNNNINTNQNNNINDNLSNNKLNNYNNSPSPNSSIDIKSLVFQSKKNNIMNKNNMNNINNNALSEDKDNVNINLTETIMSNQIFSNNGKKNDEIMPSNNFTINNQENNKNNKKLHIIENTQIYTFNDNAGNDDNGNNNEKKDNIDDNNNMKYDIKNNQNSEINTNDNLNQLIANNNNNGSINNYNSVKKQINEINNPSLIIQNNNFYSQNNNYPNNNININTQSNNREINMDNNSKEMRRSSKKYNRISRINQNKKDSNYVKAVVSINIPAEEQENINLVKQFNLLVDRLNGQKSKSKAKEIIKRSDRYYELYKTPNGNILKSLLNQNTKKRQIKHNYYFDISSNISNTSKYGDISNNNIYNNDISNITYGKNNNLNSRILALKERTFTTMNNSFRNENNIKDYYKNNNNDKTDIVLPSNFTFNKII